MPVISKETAQKLKPYRTTVLDFIFSFIPIIPFLQLESKSFPQGFLIGSGYRENAEQAKAVAVPAELLKDLATTSFLLMCLLINKEENPNYNLLLVPGLIQLFVRLLFFAVNKNLMSTLANTLFTKNTRREFLLG